MNKFHNLFILEYVQKFNSFGNKFFINKNCSKSKRDCERTKASDNKKLAKI